MTPAVVIGLVIAGLLAFAIWTVVSAASGLIDDAFSDRED